MTRGKKKGKSKQKPEWRVRYDTANPILSMRVTEEILRMLREVTKMTGMSYADVLKIGLGIAEVKMKPRAKVWQEAYDEGKIAGHTLAVSVFMITYACGKCGETIELDTPRRKASGWSVDDRGRLGPHRMP